MIKKDTLEIYPLLLTEQKVRYVTGRHYAFRLLLFLGILCCLLQFIGSTVIVDNATCEHPLLICQNVRLLKLFQVLS